ncbi:MAG: monodechloroaminopyrrolnitrin synthase PrnB family protein [Rhodospirillaceae bacterium]
MSVAAENFDAWIRSSFRQMNTALEELYFAQEDRANVEGIGEPIKKSLAEEGLSLVRPLVAEGNTNEGFERTFGTLGNLGLLFAALRRHELTNPAREQKSPFDEASALGMHIAASLGVVPRFANVHLNHHNRALDGVPKSFTTLKDEKVFNDYNTFSILCYQRAGDALARIPALGISNPATALLLRDARAALEDVLTYNELLFAKLDPDRFFYSVRPYFKPYRVGRTEYRGANAGDFSAINEIDLLLGVCRGNDPYYSQLLVDKMLYLTPEDQARLRACLTFRPLLDDFVDAIPGSGKREWFKAHAALFVDVCAAHGKAAVQHHDKLVDTFIVKKTRELEQKHLAQITASGPPLPVLVKALEKLRDLRAAVPSAEFETAYGKLKLVTQAAGLAASPS